MKAPIDKAIAPTTHLVILVLNVLINAIQMNNLEYLGYPVPNPWQKSRKFKPFAVFGKECGKVFGRP
jgi:hypothetical protein